MKSTVQLTQVPRPRARLGFWRFLLALLMGLGAWWSIGWLLEPKPLWKITYSPNQPFSVPISEDETGQRLAAFEMKSTRLQDSTNIVTTAMLVLDAGTGKELYRLPLDNEEWEPTQHWDSRWAQPRLVGDTVWRIAYPKKQGRTVCELRAWRFKEGTTEKTIRLWPARAGTRLEIAFGSPHSPYFVTQASFPWEPLTVGLGLDGWSRLLFMLANPPQDIDFSNQVGLPPPGGIPTGLSLKMVQTWKLEESPQPHVELLATWLRPVGLRSWPPAMAHDLSWLAFHDLNYYQIRQTIHDDNNAVPAGIQLHQGRTGQVIPVNIKDNVNRRACGAGDLILVYPPPPKSAQNDKSKFQLLDALTGQIIPWPSGMPEEFRPLTLLQDPSLPNRSLVVTDTELSPEQMGFIAGHEAGIVSLLTLERTSTGVQLIQQSSFLKEDQFNNLFASHYLGDELGIFGMQNAVPPLLRKLCDQWDWLKKTVDKIWETSEPALILFDARTGNVIRTVHGEQPVNWTPHAFKYQLYTMKYHSDQAALISMESLSAWKLPMALHAASAWWSRAAGVVVFLLAMFLVRRRGA